MCCIPGKGARGGIWPLALSAEVAKLSWLRFIRNSGDNPCFFRGLKSPPASSLQCAASLMEWTGIFLFKVNFVLNHELQLKLAKLWFPGIHITYIPPVNRSSWGASSSKVLLFNKSKLFEITKNTKKPTKNTKKTHQKQPNPKTNETKLKPSKVYGFILVLIREWFDNKKNL